MEYLSFITDRRVMSEIIGSPEESVRVLEIELGYKLPNALNEYLILMGEKSIYREYDYHGTKDMLYLHEWIYEWIKRYREEGVELSRIKEILPFDKFQDTFFYVPIEAGIENPPVYAFDINETPEIRKLFNSFSDFVKWKYDEYIKNLGHR